MQGADDRIIATEGGFTPRRVLLVLAIGCVTAAVLGSTPLLGWTENLPDRPGTALIHDAALRWHSAMQAVGATGPYTWVRHTLRAVEAKPPG
jgi:hypothetical protein